MRAHVEGSGTGVKFRTRLRSPVPSETKNWLGRSVPELKRLVFTVKSDALKPVMGETVVSRVHV
jgi:hypothetical protein